MRRILKKIVIALALFFAFYLIVFHVNPYAWNAKVNRDNIPRIHEGMTLDSALLIMGKPDNVWVHDESRGWTTYKFNSPLLYSDDFGFIVDSKGVVVVVIDGN